MDVGMFVASSRYDGLNSKTAQTKHNYGQTMSADTQNNQSDRLPAVEDEQLLDASALSGSSNNPSLQDSFKQFRDKKIKEKQLIKLCQESSKMARSVDYKELLRAKLVDAAKKYLHVPYSEKFRNPDEPIAPLYLDCCGLVRQILLDLQVEFGFVVGRWNQCYQIDTLPIVVEDASELKPGDLIFYEGKYRLHRAKQQKHDMVHVEIFLGGTTGEVGLPLIT
jgi:cell wall-associated NlpC family hydrolase